MNMKLNKIKNYLAFLAAIFNIIASSFFFDAVGRKFSDPNNVSDSFGTMFFIGSIVLWTLYIVISVYDRFQKR